MAADASAPTFPTRFKRPTFVGGLGGIFVVLLVVLLFKEATVSPSQFAQTTLIGLTNGAVYALIALGYTLVYGILELINFAHGDVFMLGGMFAITIGTHVFGLHHGQGPVTVLIVFATLVLTMLACGSINATIEFVAYRPLRGAPRLAPLITAIGVSFIIQDVGLAWKGPNYITAPDVFPHSNVFSVGSVDYQWNHLVVVIITVPVLLALLWLVQRTRQGKAMREGAYDYVEKPLTADKLNRLKALIPKALDKFNVQQKNRELSSKLEGLTHFGELTGSPRRCAPSIRSSKQSLRRRRAF